MENKGFLRRDKVVLLGEYNGVSVSLVERFLANFLSVKVVCGKRELWEKYSPYLFSNDYFEIVSFGTNVDLESDFLVFISSFYDNLSFLKEDEIVSKEEERLQMFLSFTTKKKKFSILPYRVYDPIGLKLVEVYNKKMDLTEKANLFVCYAEEMVGPRMILTLRGEVASILHACFSSKKLFFYSEDSFLKVCTPGAFSREFVRLVLENEPLKERRILFLGRKLSRDYFLQVLEDVLKIKTNVFSKTKVFPYRAVVDKSLLINFSFDKKNIEETIDWFKRNQENLFFEKETVVNLAEKTKNKFDEKKVEEMVKRVKLHIAKLSFLVTNYLLLLTNLLDIFKRSLNLIRLPKVVFKKRKTKEEIKKNGFIKEKRFAYLLGVLKLAVFFVVVFLVFPLFLFATTGFLFYLGHTSFNRFSFSQSAFFLKSAEKTSCILSENFYDLGQTPVLGVYYLFLGESSSVVCSVSRVFSPGISLIGNVSSLYEKSLKGQEIDTIALSRKMFLDLNSLYFNTSLLEGKISDFVKRYTFVNVLLKGVNLSRYSREIVAAKEISLLLPDILGAKEERRYLLLFQNNMELRPTGGFIGSFAILTFRRGSLSNLEIYDVYDADGQLRGYVEPPWQLKKYLDQPAWYLRDSNWDSDFSVSAKRAQWFLDKSMGIKVDGVFSFDTSFVKDLVSVIGPINVVDYDKTIDAKIFYDVVQYEAEKGFFPGSRQKRNFLTALTRSILFEIKEAKPDVLMSFLPVFYKNFNERHLQMFFNNEKIQEKVSFLGWDGKVNRNLCFSENCFGDFVALVESNFGVNKANYFVSRRVDLRVDIEKDFIIREMEVVFENKAPLVLGDKGKYKNYFRVFLPASVSVEKAEIWGGNSYYNVDLDQEIIRDMKEVGFLIEIFPASSKKVILVWKDRGVVDLSKNGEYRFVFRKQSGVDELPFNLEVRFPSDFKAASDNLRLTKDGFFVYNQSSQKTDFVTRFYW